VERVLKAAWFEHRCNACGGSYHVTLYDVLQEARLGRSWTSARPNDAHQHNHSEYDSLIASIPTDRLEAVAAAWEALLEVIPPSLQLKVAKPPAHEH
jgi:DNA-binding FadR family transcriptional regulator